MAWYEDLAVCDCFSYGTGARLRAVGWLARDRPFSQGEVDSSVFDRLCELTQDPWSPAVCAGVHFCELCRFTGNGTARFKNWSVSAVGSGVSLFVPGDGVIYVSPTSITHYVDSHGYQPPAEFAAAVLRCPPMRSMAYLKAIRASGGAGLWRLASGGVSGPAEAGPQ